MTLLSMRRQEANMQVKADPWASSVCKQARENAVMTDDAGYVQCS